MPAEETALSGAEETALSGSNETAVIDYLRTDPDFFVRHAGLLAELNLPHASGRAVSLIERQVAIMRERNVDMRRKMNELLDTARRNDGLFAKTRSLILALLDADSLQELNEILATYVLVDFEADFVCCHVSKDYKEDYKEGYKEDYKEDSLDHIRNHEGELPFAHLVRANKTLCTTLRSDELQQIFPASSHPDSGSAVILPLTLPAGTSTPRGVLCIGSTDPHHFSNDMETLFVTYIAEVLAKVLLRF